MTDTGREKHTDKERKKRKKEKKDSDKDRGNDNDSDRLADRHRDRPTHTNLCRGKRNKGFYNSPPHERQRLFGARTLFLAQGHFNW